MLPHEAEWSIFRTEKANPIKQPSDSASPPPLVANRQPAGVLVPILLVSNKTTFWGEGGRGREIEDEKIRTSSRVFSAMTLCIPIPTPSITANRIAHPIAEFLAALKPPRIAKEPPVRNPAPTMPPTRVSLIHQGTSALLYADQKLKEEKTHTRIPRILLLPKTLDRTVKR